MNVREKIYTETIVLRLKKEEHDLLLKSLCRKKGDKLSVKLRDYIFTNLKNEPVIEYVITQDSGITGVTLFKEGIKTETLFFDCIGHARSYIKEVGAIKRVKGE